MYSLHSSLRQAGVDSSILCLLKSTDSEHVHVIPELSWGWRQAEKWIRRITSRLGLNDVHRISSGRLSRLEIFKQADIVHFHGTHSGFLSYLALPQLTRDKPAVFTLHDMWCLTGHCAYSIDCERWKNGCGSCPYPEAYPPVRKDATHIEWKLKRWSYDRSKINIICVSSWLAELARQSILHRHPVYHIPNGISLQDFVPQSRIVTRKALGIPAEKKVLMFSATEIANKIKGADILVAALKDLAKQKKKDILMICMGNGSRDIFKEIGIEAAYLGYLVNARLKALVYSAADLFVLPTRADNLPLVIQESMACGTPVVSFRVGGVPDLVRHGETGYLAEPEDAADLRKGITQLLADEVLRSKMADSSWRIAAQEYSLELQAKRHLQLYRKLLGEDCKSKDPDQLSS